MSYTDYTLYSKNPATEQVLESLSKSSTYNNELALSKFIHIFDNKVTCYKFYWFESILILIAENPDKLVFSFEQLINEMIANAWYTIREYHLHMGTIYGTTTRRNAIETVVNDLATLTNLKNDASRREIKYELLRNRDNAILKKDKADLSMEVPFHFLSSFLSDDDRKVLRKVGTEKSVSMLNTLNKSVTIPYTFSNKKGLEREIILDKSWKTMLLDSIVPLRGWIQYEKIKYLQERNPDTHGIIYKLDAAKSYIRKLNSARSLWSAYIDVAPFYDIYTGKVLSSSDFDLDHFIPWSFLTNDELWDLIPADGSINSKKRNYLPSWDDYFDKFGQNQYGLYKMIYSSDKFYSLFTACQKDNLKTYWGGELLYVQGRSQTAFLNILYENLRPQYDAALRQGFSVWHYFSQ